MNCELSTCRAMLNDAVVNDWLVRSPFVKAKKGELIAIAHEATLWNRYNRQLRATKEMVTTNTDVEGDEGSSIPCCLSSLLDKTELGPHSSAFTNLLHRKRSRK